MVELPTSAIAHQPKEGGDHQQGEEKMRQPEESRALITKGSVRGVGENCWQKEGRERSGGKGESAGKMRCEQSTPAWETLKSREVMQPTVK